MLTNYDSAVVVSNVRIYYFPLLNILNFFVFDVLATSLCSPPMCACVWLGTVSGLNVSLDFS